MMAASSCARFAQKDNAEYPGETKRKDNKKYARLNLIP
jgi:hypothetical protein